MASNQHAQICAPCEGDDPVAFVVSLNLHRRHLSESQRGMVAARLANLTQGRPAANAPIGAFSQEEAAELLNVGRNTVQRARSVIDEGAPELVAAVESGHMAVSLAALSHGGDRVSDQVANLHLATRAEAAKLLNVSKRTVDTAAKVQDEGAPELVAAVESGLVSVSAAPR